MSESRRVLILGDDAATLIVWGIAFCAAAVIGIWSFAYMTGVVGRQAPRTLAERQLVQLDAAVRREPEMPQVWADYARALIVSDRLSEAGEALDRAEDLGSAGPQTTLERARLAVARGQDARAIELASKTESEAVAYRVRKQKEYGEKAVTVDSEFIMADVIDEAARIRGQLLAKASKWVEAESAFELAHREKSTDSATLVMLGRVREELADKQGAIDAYREALVYVPDHPEARAALERLGAL